MNNENVKQILVDVENLGSFFSFFKKKELKSNIVSSLEELGNELETIQKKNFELDNEFNFYKKKSKEEQEKLSTLFESYKIETKNTIESKDKEITKVSTEFLNINTKHSLVSKLLSTKSNNKGLEEYKKILYNDFMTFANNEDSLANEAEAILKLQSIEKELEVISSYPQLHKKNIVAIGGGFSSGKSEFISSFFKSEIKLPIGIEPTTAIPAYIMNNEHDEIIACSHLGGIVDFKDIDENFHSKISHGFIKSFDFNLKDIMPYMVYATKLEYEHICFIDTPGYNPASSDDSYTIDDINTAKEFLNNSSTLIWLIGADSNGTISSSDLDFLSNLDLENKKLFVVLNKADLRSESDIFDIVEEIRESLEDYDINYCGISSFSSIQQKEYTYIKQSLFDFIYNCNYESQVHQNIIKRLYDVYMMYKFAILKDIKEKKAIQSHIKSISIDILQEGFDDFSKPVYQRLNKLEKIFDSKEKEKQLEMLFGVINKLKIAIDNVFKYESTINFEDIQENEIEIDFDLKLDEILEDFENLDITNKQQKKNGSKAKENFNFDEDEYDISEEQTELSSFKHFNPFSW